MSSATRSQWILRRHAGVVMVLAVVSLILFFVLHLNVGAVRLTGLSWDGYFTSNSDSAAHTIFWQLRVPRALLAVLVGATLAGCGALSQGLFRNPLADPSLIGVSAGGAAGAAAVVVLLPAGFGELFGLSLTACAAFAGALLSVIFVYRIATNATGTSVSTMLLAGIAVSFSAGALAGLFEYLADNHMLRQISLWRMGGFGHARYREVLLMAAVGAILLIAIPRYLGALNAQLLGESEARHLGYDTEKLKRGLVMLIAAGVGVSVAIAGTIAFIGLVVPHMMRVIVGPDHRRLVPLSALAGASLALVADLLARRIAAPAELPVGLITAFVGAPIFVSLLRRRHHYRLE